MKNKFRSIYLLYFLGITALFTGCDLLGDLDRKNFIQLQNSGPKKLRFDEVVLQADVQGIDVIGLSEHGFLWSSIDQNPTLSNFEGRSQLGTKETNGPFQDTISGFRSDQKYFYAAYVISENEPFYSEVDSFSAFSGNAITLTPVYPGKRDLTLKGQIFNVDEGLSVIEHGFAFSFADKKPTLADFVFSLGPQTADTVFSFTAKGVLEQPQLHIRTYGVVRGNSGLKVIWGEKVTFSDKLHDVWEEQFFSNGPGNRTRAVAFGIGGKGYLGTGLGNINPFTRRKDFFEFDPEQGWVKTDPLPGIGRDKAFSFVMKNDDGKEIAFVGGGEDIDGNKLRDFYAFDPSKPAGQRWKPLKSLPPSEGRADAAAFALDTVAYIIGGRKENGSQTNEVWAYNRRQDKWSPKNDFPYGARFGATAMTLNKTGYFGLGRQGNTNHSDFYKYLPEQDTWIAVEPFLGKGRFYAAAIALGNRGFITTGEIRGARYSKDLWMYDADATEDCWKSLPKKPGQDIHSASMFPIGKELYLYGGADNAFFTRRFWTYFTK